VRKLYFGAAALWTVFVTVCCLVSMHNFDSVPVHDGYTDKYVHCTFYFVFTVLWYMFLKTGTAVNTKKHRLWAFLLAVIYGIFIEGCQQFFTHDRSADITDVAANTTGAALAVLVLWLLNKRKNNTIPNR